jgi:poly(3-hydroxybutyrate) depolymerase
VAVSPATFDASTGPSLALPDGPRHSWAKAGREFAILYQLYEAQRAALIPARAFAGLTKSAIDSLPAAWTEGPAVRRQSALCEMTLRTGLTHRRPDFGIDDVVLGGKSVGVREEAVVRTPFGTLTHFEKEGGRREEPRVLLVAALAGHFSTLMRDTVRTMLPDHDVYLAEWNNARDVPLRHGRFGLDDYIAHLVDFLEELGPGTHLMAVCQPCPAAIAATAILAQRKSPSQPRSLTLMAGPVDTSSNPTAVNDLATTTPLSWFENKVVTTVPLGYRGFGRRVYPGFLQLTAFVSMNVRRHVEQQGTLFKSLVRGDVEKAESIESFYDEYFAVLDMPAEFYLETIDAVFQRRLLAIGEFSWRGQHVDPGAIRSTALLTVEGERDDVCGLGQTLAAHDLLTGVAPSNKRHHLQVGVGHYGVFSGRRWQLETYPIVREFILLYA